VWLLMGVGTDASYVTDVLPGVAVFGLGLSLLVAPLTSTVLISADSRHAGVASGINNAVARAAGLLAVAVLPVVAGISGDDYQNPEAFADGFQVAMMISSVLLVLGALISAVTIRNPPESGDQAAEPDRHHHCGVDGPPLHLSPLGSAGKSR
jgi:Na+/melibiose symporter-like transporter